jgi:nucleotide-binding universal stress UspA family protein
MLETIIFATDLTPEWDEIIDCAGQFRELGCSRVVLTHVIKGKSSKRAAVGVPHELTATIEQQRQRLLSQGLDVLVEMPPGLSTASINEIASHHGASLIVVGSHGKSVLREVVMGSFSNALLHRTRFPVLLINMRSLKNGGKDDNCQLHCSELLRHCLVPTDFLCSGERVCQFIAHLASKGLSRVTVLHATEIFESVPDAFVQWYEAVARDCLRKVERQLNDAGVSHFHTRMSKGQPGSTILKWLEGRDVSLVIMETHGKSLLSEVMLGSVAYDVARLAPCPVLLVPREKTG